MNNYIIDIRTDASVPFSNQVDFCVGTGRMGLALHKEYLDQLAKVQNQLGFKYIRGHGLFSDDMAFCQAYTKDGEKHLEFNYTYIDRVMDSYLEIGIRPFLELGFMPEKIASGQEHVFYWKGNITPPEDYCSWRLMVKSLLTHLIERYGKEEVLGWPVEVWNEPNLKSFWKDGDRKEYFRLYRESVLAVKELDSDFKVGGPAICGIDDKQWLKDFLDFVKENKLPLDFITRHHYTIEFPEVDGHYSYTTLYNLDESFAELEASREIIDDYHEFRGMDIHITEFNTAYVPDCPLHDTNLNAAYTAALLSRLGDKHASYSFWTFGDVFEEKGVPFTPFHGGFGMLANGGIPKPVFWTFVFFKQLMGKCLYRSENTLILTQGENSFRGIIWNIDQKYTGGSICCDINFPAEEGNYCLLTKRVDENCCNPLKLWHDMGEPAHLMPEQKELLLEHAKPLVQSESLLAEKGKIRKAFNIPPNGVLYFELFRVEINSDRGYSYERVCKKGT